MIQSEKITVRLVAWIALLGAAWAAINFKPFIFIGCAQISAGLFHLLKLK
jgi:hypothetical protein